MYSEMRFVAAVLAIVLAACTPYRKIRDIRSGNVGISIAVNDEKEVEQPAVSVDSIKSTLTEGPIIMNAIRDSETGEMVATDVISASRVTARFRNVAERAGFVSVCFDVTVPAAMCDSDWQLKVCPMMQIQSDTVHLDPVYITGKGYRQMQLRGYQRYRAFLSSIVTDTTDLLRMGQLEIFLRRHYPQTYSMKTDTTFVSGHDEENLFGVTVRDAVRHYTRHWKVRRNEWKKKNKEKFFERYVKDPMPQEGIRLDTVLSGNQTFVYRYIHTFRSRPMLKKVKISVGAGLYQKGIRMMTLRFPDDLTFYISSLASLADNRIKYRMIVRERVIYDNTKALIDFKAGSAVVDTTLGDNASELSRIIRCIDDVVARRDLVLDSLLIVASCSPEGPYMLNRRLSSARSDAVRKYLENHFPDKWRGCVKTDNLPENWKQLRLLVLNDTIMEREASRRIVDMIDQMKDCDKTERRMSSLPQYRYLREKLYPKLRSVSFDFHLHRAGMVKDTVHTTEVDTVYMAGLGALKQLDYKRAVSILRPYADYNAALAYLSADYNHSALAVLERLGTNDAKVCYLMALALSRLKQADEALKYLELSLRYDPYMRHRANLDPEMSSIVVKIKE